MIRLVRLRTQFFKQLKDVDLWFPPTCRVMVSGNNEAGKSSLFEAVYFGLFGDALVTEEGRGRLDDLLTYGHDEGSVELWLDLPNRQMQIRRRLRRNKSNEWEVDLTYPNGRSDPVRGNAATNSRVVAELGFDKDTLLNTCFIEQKKLDRLEGLSATQREASLKRLLNLDELVKLENDLKVHREDEVLLERLRQRAELAAVQAELPGRQAALDDVDERLRRVTAYAAAVKARDELQAALDLEASLIDLRLQRDQQRKRADQAAALYDAMKDLREAMVALERVGEQELVIAELRETQAAAARLAEAELPRVQGRLEAVLRLASRFGRLAAIETARRDAEQAAADLRRRAGQARQAAEELDNAGAELAAAEAATVAAGQDEAARAGAYAAAREAEIVDAWLRAHEQAAAPERHEVALRAARARRAGLDAEFKTSAQALLVRVEEHEVEQNETPDAGAAASLRRLLGEVRRFVTRALELWTSFVQASDELVTLEAARQTQAALAAAGQDELRRIGQRAKGQGIALPATADDAQRRLESARAAAGRQSVERLEAALGDARQKRGAADGRLRAARDLLDRLARRAAEDPDVLAAEADAQAARATRLAAILACWQPRAEQAAAELGLVADTGAAQAEVARLRARTEVIAGELAKAARVPAQIKQRQADLARFRRQAETSYGQAASRGDLPAWRPDQSPAQLQQLGKVLRTRYDKAGGRQAQEDFNQAEGAVQRAEAERDGHRRASQEASAQLRGLLADIKEFAPVAPGAVESGDGQRSPLRSLRYVLGGRALPAEALTDGELKTIIEALADAAHEDARLLSRQRDDLQARVGYLREQRVRLARVLGLPSGETLDLAECRAALEERERELEVRRHALMLVQDTSRSLLESVLPATVDRMGRLLPVLTVGRYFDAQIRAKDWMIQVWDERAPVDERGEKWRTKNIFSGGTKDQFSLALRLAFALTALPEERGAAPGFLFLDEPLGAFDRERAEALISLLTEGEVANSFDQIFLISHVPVERSAFTHHVRLEGGQVVESDLPDADT